jgi:hypothetical protein
MCAVMRRDKVGIDALQYALAPSDFLFDSFPQGERLFKVRPKTNIFISWVQQVIIPEECFCKKGNGMTSLF